MRIFVALDIPVSIREALVQLRRHFENLCSGARWVRLDGAHITVKFIGEVPAETVEHVRLALEPLRARSPFDLRFAGLGFFPNDRRPRVFWAGIEGGAPLTALAVEIETSLVPLGIPRERREFKPHLTLARFDSPASLEGLRQAVAASASAEFGHTTVAEFHLYQSVLKRSGAEYTRLATYSFSSELAS